jgi:lipopolysaccharide export system permease protein
LLAIPPIHVAILVCAETLVRQDPRFVWFVGLAIVAEIATAIIRSRGKMRIFRSPRRSSRRQVP